MDATRAVERRVTDNFAENIAGAKDNLYFCIRFLSRSLSSVGLERMLDRHEVTGSNPVATTTFAKSSL